MRPSRTPSPAVPTSGGARRPRPSRARPRRSPVACCRLRRQPDELEVPEHGRSRARSGDPNQDGAGAATRRRRRARPRVPVGERVWQYGRRRPADGRTAPSTPSSPPERHWPPTHPASSRRRPRDPGDPHRAPVPDRRGVAPARLARERLAGRTVLVQGGAGAVGTRRSSPRGGRTPRPHDRQHCPEKARLASGRRGGPRDDYREQWTPSP